MSAKLAPWLILNLVAACDAKPTGRLPSSTASSSPSSAPSSSASASPLPPIAMQFLTPHGRWASIDYWDPKTSAARCLVHRPCAPIAPLPACEKSIQPIEPSALQAYRPAATPHERFSVRGALGLALGGITFAACADRPLHQCCNGRGLEAFVGDIPNGVRLDGVRCGGDESRACCNIPAFGQTVVATGRLVEEHETSVTERGGYWALTEVTLCTESPAVTSKPSKR